MVYRPVTRAQIQKTHERKNAIEHEKTKTKHIKTVRAVIMLLLISLSGTSAGRYCEACLLVGWFICSWRSLWFLEKYKSDFQEIWHRCSNPCKMTLLSSRSKFKVICFVHDLSTVAMTKVNKLRKSLFAVRWYNYKATQKLHVNYATISHNLHSEHYYYAEETNILWEDSLLRQCYHVKNSE